MDLSKLPKFTISLTRPERKVKTVPLGDVAAAGLFLIPGKLGVWIKTELVTLAGGRVLVCIGDGKTYTNFGALLVTPCDRDGQPEYDEPERVMMRLGDTKPWQIIVIPNYGTLVVTDKSSVDGRAYTSPVNGGLALVWTTSSLDTLVEVIGTVEFVGGGK